MPASARLARSTEPSANPTTNFPHGALAQRAFRAFSLIILGLDPGSRHTGYGLVEKRGDRLRMLACGRLSVGTAGGLPERLAALAQQLGGLLDRWRPDAVSLETPFHGINARSLIVLAQARGALLVALAGRGLELHEYSPAEIKSAVTGSGRAHKDQVAKMVGLLLEVDSGSASPDATDALAAAICCAQRRRLERLQGRPGR